MNRYTDYCISDLYKLLWVHNLCSLHILVYKSVEYQRNQGYKCTQLARSLLYTDYSVRKVMGYIDSSQEDLIIEKKNRLIPL